MSQCLLHSVHSDSLLYLVIFVKPGFSLQNNWCFCKENKKLGIYQAEVCNLSHAYILLLMRLFEVVIPKMTFKFGANNFEFY